MRDAPTLPPGFRAIAHCRSGAMLGSAVFATKQRPATFLVTPRGYVGPNVVALDLVLAREFAEIHPRGFTCVVDARDVVLPNPLNVLWIRAVMRLPQVKRYVVIAPSPWLQLAIRLASWICVPTEVRTDPPPALRLKAPRSGRSRPPRSRRLLLRA